MGYSKTISYISHIGDTNETKTRFDDEEDIVSARLLCHRQLPNGPGAEGGF